MVQVKRILRGKEWLRGWIVSERKLTDTEGIVALLENLVCNELYIKKL